MNTTSHNQSDFSVKPKAFQLLTTKYADEIWDGEIYLDENSDFCNQNPLIWDLFITSYNYVNSGISVSSLKSAGFSDKGVFIIYQAFMSLLLPSQPILKLLIKDESLTMV